MAFWVLSRLLILMASELATLWFSTISLSTISCIFKFYSMLLYNAGSLQFSCSTISFAVSFTSKFIYFVWFFILLRRELQCNGNFYAYCFISFYWTTTSFINFPISDLIYSILRLVSTVSSCSLILSYFLFIFSFPFMSSLCIFFRVVIWWVVGNILNDLPSFLDYL